MKKKLLFLLTTMFALMLVLAACGDSSEESESAEENGEDESTEEETETASIDIGMLKLTGSAPLFIAVENGFFEDEDLQVNVEWFDAAQSIAVATAGGDVDVEATGIQESLENMVGGGEELLIVADKGREEEGYSSTAMMVPEDSDVEEIADLKGKQIGITQTGSTFHYMAGRLLEEHGLSTDDVELVPLNSIPGLMETLESEQVDAVLLNEPNISLVEEEGYGKQIAQVGDNIDYQTSGIFFSKKFADDEEVAKRFLKAYAKATQYYYDAVLEKEGDEIVPGENFDEVVAIIADYTDQEPEIIEKGLPYMDRDGVLLDGDIQTQIDWYMKEGLLEVDLDASEIVNTELLDEALSELGSE